MLLELDRVSKSYGDLLVLDGISLAVPRGEFLCLLGPSGSGKSTLLRLMAGFEAPDDGAIIHDGRVITGADPRRMMIFQDFNQLFPWKTVRGNVLLPLKMKKGGGSGRERRAIAERYLAMVQLDEYGAYYPHQLSGGMKQKAAIARALALEPEVLLMDEPFGSLDAQTRETLQRNLIEVWAGTGVTVVFVTHDIHEAILLADRIVVLAKAGRGIKAILPNPLTRPRFPDGPGFAALWREVHGRLDPLD